jgi:hypothetical protein
MSSSPSTPVTVRITPKHVEILAKSAIGEDAAKAWGIFSVVTPDALPADLAQYTWARGLVFPLRQADGSVVHQIRLDEPLPDGGKYLQPKGTGAIINVPQSMASRVGNVTKVLIVEGTKQTIAACQYVAEDTLVIGIQGCANFSKEGVPLTVWSTLVAPDDDVVVCFDADWTTNHNVWSAAKNLQGHLESNCFATVRLATISGGGKLGLDDALSTVGDDLRSRALAALVAKAKSSLGREPKKKIDTAAKSVPSQIDVDMAAGQIVRRALAATPGVPPAAPEVLLPAAARIIKVESIVDEANTGNAPTVQLTLEVAVKVDGRLAPVVNNVQVASAHLANVGEWLDKLPHGLGVGIPRDSRPNDEIANAIRTADAERTHVSVLPRIGWYLDQDAAAGDDEGVWRWCDGKGAIGPLGKVSHLRGKPGAKDFQAIDLEDPAAIEPIVIRQRVKDFILSRELIRDEKRFQWDVACAGWALSFLGITPNAALAYFGPPSSGKSTIAQAIASTLSPAWAPGSGSAMATFNARPAGMDLLANGMSHCFLHIDDLKPESDQQSMKAALKAFDALLRRAHGSGGAVRGGIDKDSDSLIVRGVDNSSPFVIVTGEDIPTGGDFAESGLDRVLIIPVEPRSLFGDDVAALNLLQNRAKSGQFRTVTSAYLRWIAQQIDKRDEVAVAQRFDHWKRELDADRAQMSEATSKEGIIPNDLRVSDRARLLAASLMLGMQSLLAFAVELKALDEDQADKIQERFKADLIAEVKDHTRIVMGGNATVEDQALAKLRSAVSARQVSLDAEETPNRPLIGERKTLFDGTLVVAINVRAAAEALRFVGGDRAMTKALSKVALLDSRGLPTRTLAVNKTRVQAVCILAEIWDAEDEDPAAVAVVAPVSEF